MADTSRFPLDEEWHIHHGDEWVALIHTTCEPISSPWEETGNWEPDVQADVIKTEGKYHCSNQVCNIQPSVSIMRKWASFTILAAVDTRSTIEEAQKYLAETS